MLCLKASASICLLLIIQLYLWNGLILPSSFNVHVSFHSAPLTKELLNLTDSYSLRTCHWTHTKTWTHTGPGTVLWVPCLNGNGSPSSFLVICSEYSMLLVTPIRSFIPHYIYTYSCVPWLPPILFQFGGEDWPQKDNFQKNTISKVWEFSNNWIALWKRKVQM